MRIPLFGLHFVCALSRVHVIGGVAFLCYSKGVELPVLFSSKQNKYEKTNS
jgi:hypothetical protein